VVKVLHDNEVKFTLACPLMSFARKAPQPHRQTLVSPSLSWFFRAPSHMQRPRILSAASIRYCRGKLINIQALLKEINLLAECGEANRVFLRVAIRFDFLDTAIEMFEGEVRLLNLDQDNPRVFARTGLTIKDVCGTSTPMIGTSISTAENTECTGTFGFYIKVDIGTDTIYCGVTCHHVLAPGKDHGLFP
jgi:hypothetical protein